jgi:hypothetical protein
MEKTMRKILIAALGLATLSGAALAEPGSGTDRGRVNREVQAMQQDGRWEQAIAEAQANKRAFEELRQANQPTATGSIYTRGR